MELESRLIAAALDIDLRESRVPSKGIIPLPISPALSSDQGLTCHIADCFRGHRRPFIKHVILPMGLAGGDVGDGMTEQPVTGERDARHNSAPLKLATVFLSPKMFSAWTTQVTVSQGKHIRRC